LTGPSFYRSRSLWLDRLEGDPLHPRPALPGPREVDVAIVGAGYTGLWTAYYLRRADPGIRVAVLEREVAGFGASGRNGGWCSAFMAMNREQLARRAGRGAVIALQRELFDTVDEVGRVAGREGIDCRYTKAGTLQVAASPVQLARLEAGIRHARAWGMGPDDQRLLGRAEAERRVRAAGLLGAAFTPHCAALDPARLVRGLAEVVEGLGATIYETTPVTRIRPGRVDTSRGPVRAEIVVRATEGYTATLPGSRRSLAPLYSLMLATEPLPVHGHERRAPAAVAARRPEPGDLALQHRHPQPRVGPAQVVGGPQPGVAGPDDGHVDLERPGQGRPGDERVAGQPVQPQRAAAVEPGAGQCGPWR